MHRDSRILFLAAAIVVGIGLLDYLAPAEVDFTEFYMVPVVLGAWFVGWRAGLAFGLFGAATEFLVDDLLRGVVPATALWNALSRIGVFVALALVTDRLYRERVARQAAYELERKRWERVDAERNSLLSVLRREFPRPLRALDWFARKLEEGLARNSTEAMRAQYRALRHHIQETGFLGMDLISGGRMDPSALRLDAKLVDLITVIEEAADESPERARVLLSLATRPLIVRADADLLRLAIAGVIDRCLEKSPPDDVTVLARQSGTEAAIEVNCASQDLDASDLELAQLLVASNGGRLVLISRGALRGSLVTFHLPLAPQIANPAEEVSAVRSAP